MPQTSVWTKIAAIEMKATIETTSPNADDNLSGTVENDASPSNARRVSFSGSQRDCSPLGRGGMSNGTPMDGKPIQANRPLL